MDAPQKDDHERGSFRCRSGGPGRNAELRFNEQRLAVRLFDESAGGFAVVADRRPDLRRGDVVQLHLESAVFEVRVVHVDEMGPADSGACERVFRIGLQRLGECVTLEEGNTSRWRWLPAILRDGDPGPHSPAFSVGFALAAVVVAVPLVLIVFAQHFHHFTSKPDALTAGGENPGSRPSQPHAGSQSGRSAPPANSPNPPDRAGVSSREPSPTSDWMTMARLPGASAFLVPQAIRELGLTGVQQQRIREIIDATTAAFRQLDAKSHRMSREEQSHREEKLLQSARAQSLDTLTPEQRERFQTLLGQSVNGQESRTRVKDAQATPEQDNPIR
jgi:Spy/CpxP family protein refolding chaperone